MTYLTKISRMHISIIIPTYNGLAKLKKHLPSVLAAAADGDELVIGDDASIDQTFDWLKTQFQLTEVIVARLLNLPTNYQLKSSAFKLYQGHFSAQHKIIAIRVLVSARNLRYAATVNLAAVFCTHDYFFLINNDVSCRLDCIEILKRSLTDSQLFAVGCLEYPNKNSTEKSGKNILWFERGLFQHSKAVDFETGATAWVSGGSGFFSKNKWLQLGGFDLRFYPAYWEDIDLCFRARRRGWKVWFNAKAVVYHEHESTHLDVFGQSVITQISWKNATAFTWKNSSLSQKFLFICWSPYWLVQRLRSR
ncbi:MAG: hypothetical protein COY81_00130 [Candidatus Pacebacteria bacterium CG_4_10_14_0_8_um_filter_43_12]|nr:MAG: hypothetical protein COY81_00130 [Candidatus Pacebacteria bacterium CG_4_10_14_0_8_um_filter_43_12]